MMKNYSIAIICIIFILGFNTPCSANPLSKIMSIFQRDLVLDVLYENHKNLIQDSQVYLAEDPEGEKILVGRVKKVSLTESQMSKVHIVIDQKYSEKIYETTLFVLMSNIFSKNSTAYIVAVPSLESSEKIPLKSGSSVEGISFVEYRISAAGQELKKVMDRIKIQNTEIMSQLETYVETFNTEEFNKKITALADQISQFSMEQKETFKQDILPALRALFDSLIKQLEQQNNPEESRDLEKRFQEIENLVDV
jgi:hypothetical protein